MLRLPGLLHWWNRQKPKHVTDQTKTSDEEWWRQQSHCWAPFTDKTSNWPGLWDMYNVFYRLLSLLHSILNNGKKEVREWREIVIDGRSICHSWQCSQLAFLVTIINSLVFSKLLYCSSVWANTTKKNIELLRTEQNFSARIVSGTRKLIMLHLFLSSYSGCQLLNNLRLGMLPWYLNA